MLEEFEDIKGFENIYKINKNGDIWSCFYKKIMKPQISKDGYLYVDLKKKIGIDENNKVITERKKGYIHRLLGLQYLENPNNFPEIDHIDRDNKNNSLENLRWCSRETNRNNRSDIIANMTETEQEIRKEDLKEYKRLWAEKDRREKGILEKKSLTPEELKAYKAEWMRLKRASMTQEERDIINSKKREARMKKK